MRRALGILLACGVVVVAVVVPVAGGSDGDAKTFHVELENAFGLTKDADVRVAGVRVGSVSDLDVDARSAHAIVDVAVEKPEFGGMRRDAFCAVEPQSLIGEYFLNCQPGTSAQRLAEGATVPVSQTAGTVPPDLVQDVLRRPYRERLGIILTELGATFGARGPDLNATIRRALPALRETDGVLKLLADERATIRALTRDADTVVGKLAANREDVARFVSEARDTATASANRRAELAGTIRRLPAFERALRPTLADLGTAARLQTPALADLRAAAPDLTTLLRRLGPFASATRPAVRSLGRASVTGRSAVKAAAPTVRKLRGVAAGALHPARNLRFMLEHLDDRANAVEPNAESPGGGKGFTGLEAFLQYPFVQSQAINLFDARGYSLKIDILVNDCGKYTNADGVARDPARAKRCSGALGPGGVVEPNPRQATAKRDGEGLTAPQLPATTPPATAAPAAPETAPAPKQGLLPDEIRVPGLPPIKLPDLSGVQALLDYLLKP